MNKKTNNRNHGGGFTLVEMLVVVLIIVILAGLISAVSISGAASGQGRRHQHGNHNSFPWPWNNTSSSWAANIRPISAARIRNRLAAKNHVLSHIAKAFPRFVISRDYYTD